MHHRHPRANAIPAPRQSRACHHRVPYHGISSSMTHHETTATLRDANETPPPITGAGPAKIAWLAPVKAGEASVAGSSAEAQADGDRSLRLAYPMPHCRIPGSMRCVRDHATPARHRRPSSTPRADNGDAARADGTLGAGHVHPDERRGRSGPRHAAGAGRLRSGRARRREAAAPAQPAAAAAPGRWQNAMRQFRPPFRQHKTARGWQNPCTRAVARPALPIVSPTGR